MKIAATLREERNMGDHGEVVTIAQEVRDGETVEEFVERVMKVGKHLRPWTSVNYANSIVLQIVEGTAEPDPSVDLSPAF